MRLFYENIKLTKPTMFFIGVSTDKSLVNDVFEDWIRIIDRNAEIIGVNLDVNCNSNEYLKIVNYIKNQPFVLGALVTTHKVRLYNSTYHLFDCLSDSCKEFEEIGAIYKNGNSLCGEVTDIFTTKSALNQFLPVEYFKTTSTDCCILGSGGAGLALAYNILAEKNSLPVRLILTDINNSRINNSLAILKKYDLSNILDVRLVKDKETDDIIKSLKKGSLIVNATGLGKDRPGSPFSQDINIPNHCYIWEFNYRGELDFLRVAKNQELKNELFVFDGWIYFIHGWTQVMSRVFNIDNIELYFDRFLEVANSNR